MSLACAITPTKCVSHTHRTHPTNKRQAAAGSLARSTLAACRHEPLAESARRSPWLPPTAPVPLPRFACFVSGSIEAIRHASISRRGSLCSPMHRSCWHGWRQRHQARRIGSLFGQAPSSGRHAPCRGVVALLAHAARLPPWLRQRRQPPRVGSLLVRWRVCWRRPLSIVCISETRTSLLSLSGCWRGLTAVGDGLTG